MMFNQERQREDVYNVNHWILSICSCQNAGICVNWLVKTCSNPHCLIAKSALRHAPRKTKEGTSQEACEHLGQSVDEWIAILIAYLMIYIYNHWISHLYPICIYVDIIYMGYKWDINGIFNGLADIDETNKTGNIINTINDNKLNDIIVGGFGGIEWWG